MTKTFQHVSYRWDEQKAAELGPDRIRVNTVNPDAVIAGSNIWSGGWAEGRAKAYGITVEELPAYYANFRKVKNFPKVSTLPLLRKHFH